MAPANPLPLEQGETSLIDTEPVSQQELNAWRRGFTPQAEIWNGRLAMLGLSVGLGVLLLVRLAGG
ncbi:MULTISPECIES: high light inducible protein [unclassified Synechococcus]|uniref:high light inducible protein n=1 Tax=unclassified Synechococcus TaxID=2626047 RepID=UPI001C22654D|nr:MULTISPECIES: high light inducible protein [unclassified Synechococcus]